MDVESIGQQLADPGGAARSIHCALVASGEQEGVGLCAAGLVGPEKGADVLLELFRQHAEFGAFRKRREGQIHKDVVSPLLPYAVPTVSICDATNQGKCSGPRCRRPG